MTVVLKLGGSVITEKDEPETVDQAALSAAVSAIAESAVGEDIVVVHGGGSFGHHHAADYGVSTTEGTHDVDGVQAIHGAMCRLNAAVVDELTAQGVPAVPVHPFSAAARDVDGTLSLPTAQVTTLLAEGFVPVLHGDLVAHAGAGATVLSGDELVVELAPAVDADRVGVCSTVPGVLDEDGTVIDRIAAVRGRRIGTGRERRDGRVGRDDGQGPRLARTLGSRRRVRPRRAPRVSRR